MTRYMTRCCFMLFKLSRGIQILGFVFFFLTLLLLLPVISEWDKDYRRSTAAPSLTVVGVYQRHQTAVLSVATVALSVGLLVNPLLSWGASRDSRLLLLPWLVFYCLIFATFSVGVVTLVCLTFSGTFQPPLPALLINIAVLPILWYWFHTVCLFYRELGARGRASRASEAGTKDAEKGARGRASRASEAGAKDAEKGARDRETLVQDSNCGLSTVQRGVTKPESNARHTVEVCRCQESDKLNAGRTVELSDRHGSVSTQLETLSTDTAVSSQAVSSGRSPVPRRPARLERGASIDEVKESVRGLGFVPDTLGQSVWYWAIINAALLDSEQQARLKEQETARKEQETQQRHRGGLKDSVRSLGGRVKRQFSGESGLRRTSEPVRGLRHSPSMDAQP